MTVSPSPTTAHIPAPAPPPPAELSFKSKYGENPMGEAGFARMCSRLPSVLRQTFAMAWRIDRTALLVLLAAQVVIGVAAAVQLRATTEAMRPILGAGTVADRLETAWPALALIAVAAGVARVATAFASFGDGRITPKLNTEADTALVAAMCRVEAAAYAEDGFADRHEAAEMGVMRTRSMMQDSQRFLAAMVRMVAAGGVLTVLHPLLLPLLFLAVLPAGVGAVLSARLDYENHYANVADRNIRGMMRWWSTTPQYGDEVRANGMTSYLLFWYRSLSERIDARTLSVAPRVLRITLATASLGGLFLVGTWAALAWLAVSGRVELAIAATAVLAVQTSLAALSQLVINGAALFHTSLYLADMRTFLDHAAARAPKRGALSAPSEPREIRLDNVSYRYPKKGSPAVDRLTLTLRRGEILAVVGENGSGKSTLTRLISGLYLADEGTVHWDDVDLALADPATVWARTGLVPQLFARWPLRSRENVTLGQPRSHDDAPVWHALDQVGMSDKVRGLPRELDTLLARELWGGVELSGGEWQRIGCSRAFYRRPQLLILDEPTSELDPRGEHRVLSELRTMAKDAITVVVTHRIENTRLADRIIVMSDGRITEQGTYDQLAAAGGTFAELLALSQDR